jgi:type I restriction enzyme, S subunit
VNTLLHSLDALIAKKRLIKQGLMRELMTGNRRLLGFGKKSGYQPTEVGAIPNDWEIRPLLSAVRIAQGQVDPKIEPYKSMTLVGPVHVEGKTGKLIFRQTAEEQGAISGKYLFEAGDIVYGKINPHLQKAFLADFSGLCSADMYPLRPQENVSPRFMLAVILGQQFTKYAVSVSVRSGMPKINRNEMKEFMFLIPADLAEQTAIADILSDMDAEIVALEAKREKTRLLKQGMMQELLTGRIRLI